jgi:hypothetical protein
MNIDGKIKIARNLFDTQGDGLRRDGKVRGLLNLLQQKILASGIVSRDLGILALCKRCDEEEGGSCCGAGIENRYSPHLLLLNLLLAVDLPDERSFANSCFFLGKEGCELKARHILCSNYLCSKILESLTLEKLMTLQAVTGEEMETVFHLHEAVKQFTGGGSHDR